MKLIQLIQFNQVPKQSGPIGILYKQFNVPESIKFVIDFSKIMQISHYTVP